MSVVLRNAVPSDLAACRALLGALRASTAGAAPVDPPEVDEAAAAPLFDASRGEILLACEDEAVLGMATVSYNVAMRYNGEYCQLEELIVTPAARGKNVGGLLLQGTIDRARARGCKEMGLYLLERTEHNRGFYARYGFEAIGAEMRQSLID